LGGKTYTWDGARRLASVADATGHASIFTYNGVGNLVRVVDTVNGSVTADHSYLWCGNTRCVAHDNTQSGSPVTAQYFNQGVIVNGTSYYYVRDRLGSVRELISSSGAIAAQYDYDPYGNPTTVSGTVPPDVGFQGFFYHAASGLYFARLRAYDSQRGRWLNRDPAAEAGGINLYSAFTANPTNIVDPTGLFYSGGAGGSVAEAAAEAVGKAAALDGMMGGPLDYVGDVIAVASLAYFFYESYEAIKDSQQAPPPDPTPTAPPAANSGASPGTSTSGAGGGNNQPPPVSTSPECPMTPPPGRHLYRGVTEGHPGYQEAANGNAYPRGGDATPNQHSGGDTASNYTSWTSDWDVAYDYATKNGSGVVLSNTFPPGVAQPVAPNIEEFFQESEYLVEGPVTGSGVTKVP